MKVARDQRPVRANASEGLSIAVELVSGCGHAFWPRPGRRISARPADTFADLAAAIDAAFGRRDLEHPRMFVLPGEVEVSWTDWCDGPAFTGTADGRTCRLEILRPGDSFTYLFDLSRDWSHLCRVRASGGRGCAR
ncbi:hypothetical protein J3R03_002892 [Actinoplanes couchii]|uniref:Uncharacterized protein n=1 Tax=Actinoplanes couchii TaxID=403638 RepID=A0ABQ3XTF4_9ACTN|nr:hypothetical protein [Actinoplanes couchii]MDR6318696.1 hypothetical protein [Actinoplanes couchii]GID61797.1 hypothetical protein Aco03nite_102010 [Actinoplanes couchii]